MVLGFAAEHGPQTEQDRGFRDSWGGQFQLWDKDVERCEVSLVPILNRCVIFETSEISYHGVLPVSKDPRYPRKSFATYYYTSEAPAHWVGRQPQHNIQSMA